MKKQMQVVGYLAAWRSASIKRIAAFSITAFFAIVTSVPALANYAGLIMDAANGQVLHEEDADLTRYPASLTKMMTLYLLFEALDSGRLTLDQRLPVSEHAASQPPTKLGLKPGQSITVENAILALVTKSANDIAAVVAESLAGSESGFSWIMTAKAREIGMSRTTFANASGLPDPEQVTTARDMAILALALLHDYPGYYHYFGTERFYYGGAVHPNHNRMLGVYPGLDGMKTGYTYAAGFNLVASAQRDGRRLIGVVLGARSLGNRSAVMASLLDQAFAGQGILVVHADEPVTRLRTRTADLRRKPTLATRVSSRQVSAKPARGRPFAGKAVPARSLAAKGTRTKAAAITSSRFKAAAAKTAKSSASKRVTTSRAPAKAVVAASKTSPRDKVVQASSSRNKTKRPVAIASATGKKSIAKPAIRPKAEVAAAGGKPARKS